MADADRLNRAWAWASRLAGFLPGGMLVFFASAFLLPAGPDYAAVFYVCVIPAALAWWWLHAERVALTPAGWLAAALIVWSGLTLLWGRDDGHRTVHFAVDAAASLVFLAGLLAMLPQAANRVLLGSLLVAAGAANAGFSIALALITHPHDPRLHGWGATTHPILGASVMATAALTALSRGLALPRHRAANLAAAALMAAFILMTESRGPLLAAGLATLALCAAGPWRWRALGVLAALLGVWLLLPSEVQTHQAHVLVARGSSRRFEIWQRTASLIAGRPLFGHGLAANVDVPGITFPHDLYLSVLFYSGIVGFALFAGLVVACTWRLWRRPAGQERLWIAGLWVNALVSGLTDLGQITKGPGPMWFIVWLPIGLLAAVSPPEAAARPRPRATPPRRPDAA